MIQSVEIHNLRGIREGKLEDLTPLVVLVGPNGCGKSTVLDALLIGASPRPESAIGKVVLRRRGPREGARWLFPRADDQVVVCVDLWTGKDAGRRVSFQTKPGNGRPAIATSVEALSPGEAREAHGYVDFARDQVFAEGPTALVIEGVPFVHLIDPDGDTADPPLHDLFSEVELRERSAGVVEVLREIVPELQGLKILTHGGEPVLHLTLATGSVPVILAGDGIKSAVRLSLDLASQSSGISLVEEPEVHQHPRALGLSAQVIWAAVRRGLQVILSTHSLELIDFLIAEARDDAELERLSVYRLHLDRGQLSAIRDSGPKAAMVRARIEEDLR